MATVLMAQFDVHRNPKGGEYPLLLDVQADLLSRLCTRLVVPITRSEGHGKPIPCLNPTSTIKDVEYVLVFQEMAAIPTSALGEVVASLASRRTEFVAAVDLLFAGI